MNKQQVISSIPVILLGGVGSLCAQTTGNQIARPNIIYIMSDDHASQAVSAYGGILANVLPGQGRYHNPILIEKGMWGDDSRRESKEGKEYEGHFILVK